MASNNEPEWWAAVLDAESVSMDSYDKEVETAIRQQGRSDDLESMRVGVGIELGAHVRLADRVILPESEGKMRTKVIGF